jgi:Protein of unknown function (DUF3109)
MIAIDNTLVSDQIIEEQFVCDLHKCKGACCEDGDAGAPLELNETEELDRSFEKLRPYLSKQGAESIEKNGRYQYDRSFGWVTPTIEGKMCAYGFREGSGIIKCAIEQAWIEGKIGWKKPISCHLFPAKVEKSKNEELEYVNYEPREVLCQPACSLGKRLKMPVYVFLKEALIRKYGEEFYAGLEAAAHFQKNK